MKNSNQGIVLLASAVVILSGAFSLGMGGLIEAISPHRGLGYEHAVITAGYVLLFMGGISFVVTYLRKQQ
tara:strand:+ start:2014 stop:2223 length:210 start_codon:yes stop_codon:yes gene_type:complete